MIVASLYPFTAGIIFKPSELVSHPTSACKDLKGPIYSIAHVFCIGTGPTAAGYWGDYNCDVPYQTTVNLMQHLQSIKDQVYTCIHNLAEMHRDS